MLLYLIKHHKALFALSIFIKSIKHLGAVMLPVFAAGIIDVVLDTHQFFCRDVYLNILGSALALVKKLQLLSFKYHNQARSGQQVQKAIDAMLSKCTIIMVAHRLNTLKKADFIYKIEGGRATLCPSYESLIEGSTVETVEELIDGK